MIATFHINYLKDQGGFKQITSFDEVTPDVRLFYELGYYEEGHNKVFRDWIRTGRFKEISNPMGFKNHEDYGGMSELEYMKHHNFIITNKKE